MTEVSFGFVAICLTEHACSPAGNVTVKSVSNLDPDAIRRKIVDTAARNLDNTIRIMHFLRGHKLHLYRMSANLIPLATHAVTDGWEWWTDPTLQPLLARLGDLARRNQVRLSSHLPEVCILSTPRSSVFQWLLLYLEYHRRMFDAMGLDECAKIVFHIGGAYNDPDRALTQARDNFGLLDRWSQRRLVLENDDKSFSAHQVLTLAEQLEIPVVFDYHHHVIRNDGEDLNDLLRRAFATWRGRPPKVHLSSPKAEGPVRAHADYVEWEFVEPFFAAVHRLGIPELDVMIEAKQKDLALFALQDEYRRKYG